MTVGDISASLRPDFAKGIAVVDQSVLHAVLACNGTKNKTTHSESIEIGGPI